MSTQVIRSLAHGVRDILRSVRSADNHDTAMFLLSSIIFYTMWVAMKPII
jgi:hypothetical protein